MSLVRSASNRKCGLRRGARPARRGAGAVLRRDAGGGAQPVVEGVLRLRLEYLDFAGRPTRVPGEVRTVVITLTTEGGQPGAGGATTLTTRVGLRNRPGRPSGVTGAIKSDAEQCATRAYLRPPTVHAGLAGPGKMSDARPSQATHGSRWARGPR